MGLKIARFTHEVELAVGIGEPRKLDSESTIKITPSVRKMLAQCHISEAEWIASARRRAAGRQDEILGTLGQKVTGGSDEDRTTSPVIVTGGFRSVR